MYNWILSLPIADKNYHTTNPNTDAEYTLFPVQEAVK